jgi:hypothetical protein
MLVWGADGSGEWSVGLCPFLMLKQFVNMKQLHFILKEWNIPFYLLSFIFLPAFYPSQIFKPFNESLFNPALSTFQK